MFSFVQECEKCFSAAIFYQFMESIIVIGFCCVQLSNVSMCFKYGLANSIYFQFQLQTFNMNFVIMVNYLCFILLQVYFYCYYGTMLIEEVRFITMQCLNIYTIF
jgi:hypothetical protein